MPVTDKAAQLAAETSEGQEVLRSIYDGLAALLPLYDRLAAIHAGSAETTLSMRKVQEAQFWIRESGNDHHVEN